jgi:hypothetical protein
LPGRSPKIDEETKDVVKDMLTGFAVTFLDEGIQKLVPDMMSALMYLAAMWNSSLL